MRVTVAATEDSAVVAFGTAGTKTLGDLRRDVARVAGQLPTEGGQVLVIAEDRYLFAVAVLAAWGREFVVILPPNTRGAAIDTLAAEAKATILHDSDADVGIDLRTCLVGVAEPIPWPIALRDDQHVVTLFTSGSTQAFRGVPKLARQLYREVAALQATFGPLGPDTRVVATVPPNHLYGLLFSVLWPLAVGAPLCRDVPLHVETIVDLLEGPAPVLVTVPAHLVGFTRLPPRRLEGVRVFSSTAPLQVQLARDLTAAQGFELIEVFGSTETGGIARRLAVLGPHWHPLPGVGIGVDEDDHLILYSDFLPDDTPYRTDDRVDIDVDGSFQHLGRADDIVKVGGRRISLGHIERCLRQVPGVHDASVIAVPDEGVRGVRILAAVVAPGLDAGHLRKALAVWLDPATTPRRYVFVDALPREPHGKLRRDRVLALFQAKSIRLTPLESEPGTWRFDVHVPDEAWYFEGHFPGYPILPGVATLHAIVVPAIESIGVSGVLREVRRLKFRHPVRPGQRLTLRLTRQAEAYEFSLTRDSLSEDGQPGSARPSASLIVASGRLRFA